MSLFRIAIIAAVTALLTGCGALSAAIEGGGIEAGIGVYIDRLPIGE